MKYLVGILIALVLIVALALDMRHSSPGTSMQGTVSTSTITATTSAYIVDAQYPVFGFEKIDAQLKQNMQGQIVVFEQLPQNPHGSVTPQNTFTGLFTDPYMDAHYVSVKMIYSQYTGGAHPMTIVSGQTYDVQTQKRLVLADVLPLIGKTVEQLSADATEQLKAQLGDSFMFPEGADTKPDNFNSFVVGSSTVTFIFQQYQVAPYVFGTPEVSFPLLK